ncbi:MAG: Wzz/FepE/Etk N-terminal domain-containing protein, partial [Pyrobaculum sp.]
MERRDRKEEVQTSDEVDLIELWEALWRRKRLIFLSVMIGTFLAIVLSLLLPKKYTSTSQIIPLTSDSKMRLPISQELAFLAGISTQEGKIKAILESKSIMERVVKELNLTDELLGDKKSRYKYPDSMAGELLSKTVNVKSTKDGTIKISVSWKDPKMAQEINFKIIEALREVLNERAFTVAKMNRIFYERELEKTEKELKDILTALGSFQQTERVLLPEEQLKKQLQLYASLLEEKLKAEAELRSLSVIFAEEHPKVQELKKRLSYISSKLLEVEGAVKSNSSLSPERALSAIPEYTALVARAQQVRARYEVLAKLLEQARMEELRENLYVEIIDPPSYPEYPSSPKRRLIVLSGFIS